jgi:AraC-like DNA-binding protein
MPKITFSSDHLPAHLSSDARASAWLGLFEETFGNVEIDPMADVPFHGHIEAVPLGETSLATFTGSFATLQRTKTGIVGDGQDDPVFVVNMSSQPIQLVHRRQDTVVAAGAAILFDAGDVARFNVAGSAAKSLTLQLPRRAFSAAVKNADDVVGRPIDIGTEPLRMLKTYAHTLTTGGGVDDPATMTLVNGHLLDLVALTLGTTRDVAEAARQGGLRAGRLNAVLAAINAGFADPAFSLQTVARRERVSERSLRDLLHESGTGFTDRVLELRLHKAQRLLANARHSDRTVIDIALSCGFNDVSYFHRSFRRRFGTTPSDARAAGAASGA